MKFSVRVVLHADDGTEAVVHEVFHLDRGALTPENLGDAKDLLAAVQGTLVTEQVTAGVAAQVGCPRCGRPRRHKDVRGIVVRSLFGTLRLPSPRWWHCPCTAQPTRKGLGCLGREGRAGMGVGRTPRVPGRVPAAGPRSPRRSSCSLSQSRSVLEGRG
ncbi:MAG: hypothetical protein JO063_08535 [Pseudonocardiales bacterium]|nr:hypothetical protein [Pseudonocardiales bacterium]MBV9030354.1 hypothetical protein [Pseudonocardiales bacterium]MBW0010150.1 hypothetical protein [Pseudonocardiales bacterium]